MVNDTIYSRLSLAFGMFLCISFEAAKSTFGFESQLANRKVREFPTSQVIRKIPAGLWLTFTITCWCSSLIFRSGILAILPIFAASDNNSGRRFVFDVCLMPSGGVSNNNTCLLLYAHSPTSELLFKSVSLRLLATMPNSAVPIQRATVALGKRASSAFPVMEILLVADASVFVTRAESLTN